MMKFTQEKWLATVLLAGALVGTSAECGMAQEAQHHPRGAAGAVTLPQLPRFRFENFTTTEGLPDNHVYAVLVDGDRV